MKRILVTGGTGTLGSEIVERLALGEEGNPEEQSIVVLSRNEAKQKAMAKMFPNVHFIAGDIQSRTSLQRLGRFDTVFHCAATKHVDVCEHLVERAVQVNFFGTAAIFDACLKEGGTFVFFSTDKAVAPINAYGASKMLAEKFLESFKGRNTYIFRWGNVIGSNGSFLDGLADSIKNGRTISITHPEMTRFWIPVSNAADFVFSTLRTRAPGTFWPSMKAARVMDIVKAMGRLLECDPQVEITGIRPGEKLHEAMTVNEEGVIWSTENSGKFSQLDLDNLLLNHMEKETYCTK